MGYCINAPNPQGDQQIRPQDLRRPEPAGRDADEARESGDSQQNRHGNGRSGQSQSHSQNTTGLRMNFCLTYLQNPGVEIVKRDKTKGEGVQKTFAYDTPLSQQKLEEWRSQFWETRTHGSKEIWMALQNACQADHETAMTMVDVVGLVLPQDSLTTAIDN